MLAASLRGLRKAYGDVVAVDGLDLDVPLGGCFGLLGPNGAGKTTTFEILEGLTPSDSGEVLVLGTPWGRDDHALRQRIGVALQETRLPDKLTVGEVLRLFRSFYVRGRPVAEVIDGLALGEKRDARVGTLSGGQRQRLALGCALVGDPELLFLDEPSTGLDPQARRGVWDLIGAFRERGGTVLLTTHSMEEAERLCDRIAVVDRGRKVAEGGPAELLGLLPAPDRIELLLRGPTPHWSEVPGVVDATLRGETWLLAVQNAARTLPPLLDVLRGGGTEPLSVSMRHATLEDVFLHLTGRDLRDA